MALPSPEEVFFSLARVHKPWPFIFLKGSLLRLLTKIRPVRNGAMFRKILYACLLVNAGWARAETTFFVFIEPSIIQAVINQKLPWSKTHDERTFIVKKASLRDGTDSHRMNLDIEFDFTPKRLSPVSGTAQVSTWVEYRRLETGGEFYYANPRIESLEVKNYGRIEEVAFRVALNLWMGQYSRAKPFFVLDMKKFFPQVTHYFLQRVRIFENRLIAYLHEQDPQWSEFIDIEQVTQPFFFKGLWIMPNGTLYGPPDLRGRKSDMPPPFRPEALRGPP